MKKIYIVILTSFLSIVGCSANNVITKEQYKSSVYVSASQNKGTITGSVSLYKGNYGWFVLKQVATGKTQHISATSWGDELAWTSNTEKGKTYLLELEPGHYQIIGWKYFIPAVGGEKEITPKNMQPIDIYLKSGENLYLGNFNFTTLYGKNIFGITIPASVKINTSDKRERDFKNIKKKYPNINTKLIKSNIINYSM
jgi:hypothetical protein